MSRRAIITIVKHNGEYLSTFEAGRKCESRMRAGYDPEAAAAKAMELAVLHGEAGYAIFAPREVLALIPEEMRSRERE